MKFNELKEIYTDAELSALSGDPQLRKQAFSPILSDLYENKLIDRKRFYCVGSLSEIELTQKGYRAKCTPFAQMAPIGIFPWEPPEEGWYMGGIWDTLRLIDSSINCPSAGWTISPEKDRVREICEILLTSSLSGLSPTGC